MRLYKGKAGNSPRKRLAHIYDASSSSDESDEVQQCKRTILLTAIFKEKQPHAKKIFGVRLPKNPGTIGLFFFGRKSTTIHLNLKYTVLFLNITAKIFFMVVLGRDSCFYSNQPGSKTNKEYCWEWDVQEFYWTSKPLYLLNNNCMDSVTLKGTRNAPHHLYFRKLIVSSSDSCFGIAKVTHQPRRSYSFIPFQDHFAGRSPIPLYQGNKIFQWIWVVLVWFIHMPLHNTHAYTFCILVPAICGRGRSKIKSVFRMPNCSRILIVHL